MQERILDALRRGSHAEALSLARVAAAEAPQDARTQAVLSLAEQANGHREAARTAIQRAILLSPDTAEFHFQHAGLLLGEYKLDEAQTALVRSVNLDPNQFETYIMQAQLALGRSDLDDAERLQRSAARLMPSHPWVVAIEGMVASRRGDGARAQRLLTQAAEKAPDDQQVLYALGFAHLQQGQHAFAEQAFRKLIDMSPQMQGLRGLLADILLSQQRPDEAREVLQPLLDSPEMATPALKRMTAELELMLGRDENAVRLLREAFLEEPRDVRTLDVLIGAWRRSGDIGDAQRTLDEALTRISEHDGLWRARLACEREGSEGAESVIKRWLEVVPGSISALEEQMYWYERQNKNAQRDLVAQKIIELEPGRSSAEIRIVDKLLRETPDRAVDYVEALIQKALTAEAKRNLLPWLGLAQDRAGRQMDAISAWTNAHVADAAAGRWPLTQPSSPDGSWPELATVVPGTPPLAYLWGLPGSGVEHVATVMGYAGYPLCADRFGTNPPSDPLQNPDTIAALAEGRLTPDQLLTQWRAMLPTRGIYDGTVIDWLPFWDNSFLKMMCPLQPEAVVLIAMRDPRDTLLEWMAYGSVVPYAFTSPIECAHWMAQQLKHIIVLTNRRLLSHKIIRTDYAHADVEAFAAEVGGGLGLEQIRVPPPAALGPQRFEPGHWHQYAKALAEPFAALSDVAQALGYPAR